MSDLSHKAYMPGLFLCFVTLCTPFVIALSYHLPLKWFLIPGVCFLVVLFLRHCDLRGVVLYWTMLSVQFWGVFIVVFTCGTLFFGRLSSAKGAFSVSSFWLIWETRRFWHIERSLSTCSSKAITSVVALALGVSHILIIVFSSL